jgi:hypothetical protein
MAQPNLARYRRTPGIAPAGAPKLGVPANVPQADMPEPDGSQIVPPGPIVQYYSDLASGAIAPEDMRIESLAYRVQIDPVGNIAFESDKVSLISRYNFAIRRIVGFAMDADFIGNAAFLVGVQVREEGRNFEIFKRPINMAQLLRNGAGGIAEWDGVYITVPGTDLSTEWSVDTQRWAALVGASKEFGIQIEGDYVACAPERG